MKAVILAAGYATRLEPITHGEIAKTLLPIYEEGKTQSMLYFILDKILKVNEDLPSCISEIFIITNDKYSEQIVKACDLYGNVVPINIISDGTTRKEEALGANRDLQLANAYLDTAEDVLVIASDNYFDFELTDMINKFDEKADNTIKKVTMVASKQYPTSKREYTHNNFGILKVDGDKVKRLIEKPKKQGIAVDSDYACIACYVMARENFNIIDKYIEKYKDDEKKRDSLGYFISYLIKRTTTYNYGFTGKFVDIGTPEEYEKVAKINL